MQHLLGCLGLWELITEHEDLANLLLLVTWKDPPKMFGCLSCTEAADGTEDTALVTAESVMHSGLLHSITLEIDKLEGVQE